VPAPDWGNHKGLPLQDGTFHYFHVPKLEFRLMPNDSALRTARWVEGVQKGACSACSAPYGVATVLAGTVQHPVD
jgi:hypothetical protein